VKREVLIVSPFVAEFRTKKMLVMLNSVLSSGAKVTVVTRPPDEYKADYQARIAQLLNILKDHNITVIERSKIHQKFAVIDRRTTWYGSINLLSFGNSEESIMRLESKDISEELLRIECN
jgi:phosphatidylserine/phosphatidylglycerophosphate/cardiolipin synthase-like enzyme